MNPTKIIIDSTVDIAESYRGRACVVPLTVRFGDRELIDGVTVTRQRFYKMLIESDTLPTTSQATPGMFEAEYEKLNGQDAVVITLSAKLSGTWQSACVAAQHYPNVRVVDSGSAATGSGILAEYAIACAEAGMSAEEIARCVERTRLMRKAQSLHAMLAAWRPFWWKLQEFGVSRTKR